MMKVLPAALLLGTSAVVLAQDMHDHDHDHGMDCACHAEHDHHDFGLDCADAAAITASATTLAACEDTEAGCAVTDANGVETCTSAYMHIAYIHGACDHDALTEAQEALYHAYEDSCVGCSVSAPYNAALPACAAPDCADTATPTAALAVLATANATDVCTTDETIAAWVTVVSVHDLCDHEDAAHAVVEDGYHTYEEACEDSGCNSVAADYDPAVCVEEEGDDHDHDHDHDEAVVDCDEHDHDHRRRLDGDHDEECEHGHTGLIVLGVVVVLAIGGGVFAKVKGLGPFAEGEKDSSG
jgi:hypothetical protein